MKTRMILAAGLMLALVAAGAHALEVTQGNVKLVLYEKSGRFNVFVSKPGAGQPFAFLVKDDPRTTMLQILVDNNIYTMGDEANFKQVVEKTATGARIVWSSPLMRVTEEFVFLTATDTPLTEGVKIVIKIDNVSEVDHVIAVRYLLDTYLGEKAGTHFVTSTNATFAKEAAFNVGQGGFYWISPNIEGGAGQGLLSLADGKSVTQPETVVFANWKRLYEANWDYKTAGNLDFNFFPYSFNDSAVAQYYPKMTVKKKSGREIVMMLGNAASYNSSKTILVAEQKTEDLSADKNKLLDMNDRPVEDKTIPTPTPTTERINIPATVRFTGSITKPLTKNNFDLVYAEIAKLDQFITDINAKIQAGKPLTADELAKYRAALADLETKASLKE
jgi:hypothetical protein